MSEIYLADRECKVNASEALQEIDKQYLGWGWNTEQTTLDLVDYAKDLERQLELAKINERDLNDIIQALNDELNEKERQLAEARELTNKFIKRTESVLESLYQDGSEEGHSEFFYRMNSKEQVLHEGFLRKLKQLKEKG